MPFFDLLRLSLRNLREAKLRATLTSMGVIVGVAVIVTMVSFGLGLQRNMLTRFRALDLFNEIRVFGKSVFSMAMTNVDPKLRRDETPGDRRGPAFRTNQAPTRILDDDAVAEIQKIPGVAYVEPDISFNVYVRCNGRVAPQSVAGASVPNASSRFKTFAAGKMITSMDADEAVIDDVVAETCGYAKPVDAIGQTIEFLTTRGETDNQNESAKAEADQSEEDTGLSFFGLPLEENDSPPANKIAARTLRIAGVLGREKREGAAQGGPTGLMMNAQIYVPLPVARDWARTHRNPMSEVALALARQSGQLNESQNEGYGSAVVRVSDPVALTEVRKRIAELGFGSFSIVDQLDQIRTVFLIIDSVLGLLGGISLLVASFGIANTMIMSILERTREIGIMKAIGAEDREIKLIFFFEAAVIGLTGGVIGSLAAWGIDAVANRLAYRFILKPQGASFVDFFSLPPYLWLGAIVFALLVSILAALYPASRAARIDPVRALRHD
ncbi:MAG TPA: FtsX-like permease family protein [Pyrinomonadaceae bacterium]|jgi:ABC-type lipoprotein release transport system permease subunit|nr:FtsX-like permease family protein [Pyrinomonadaceae bacterium]